MKKRPPSSPSKSPPPPARPTPWAEVADWYDHLVGDAGSEYHREVILPGILRLLNLKPDHSPKPPHGNRPAVAPPNPLLIIDLACGQGVLCRKLASLGHHLIGIDSAAPLIAAAEKRNTIDHLPIRYLLADATKLLTPDNHLIPPLAPNSADAITLVLAIQNISPLSPVWHACHALLKPAGTLLLVMMHPCFRIPRASDWHWDDATHTQSRLVRQYLTSSSIPIQTHPGLAAHGENTTSTTHFHRPLQAYINTLGNAHLLLDHIEEWTSHKKSQPGPRQKPLDQSRQEIPLFLALRARKTS